MSVERHSGWLSGVILRLGFNMRFLLAANASGSLVNFRLDLILAMQGAGYDVHVVSPDIVVGSYEYERLIALGVVPHSLSMSRSGINPFVDLIMLWSLFRLMLSIKPDIFMGYTIKPVIWGSLAAFLARVPGRYALITGLGYAFVDVENSGRKRKLVRFFVERLYSFSLRFCSKIFFQNPDDERLFRDLGILIDSASTVVVKGSGVNLSYFYRAPLPRQVVFIMISRLLVDKGVREYAGAASLLKRRFPWVRFKLVGYLDDNPETVSQVELDSWVSSGVIDYLGRLSDVRPAIASASVFVLPTFYREGIPRTLLEALAMGRAIITTDMPGCRETVIDGVNGFLVSPRSVEALVAALEKLILRPELLINMSCASHQLAVDNFDVHKVNAVMLQEMGVQ